MKILSFYYFFYFLALSAYSPYLSLYFADKGFDAASTGLILSLWAFAGVVSPPVMGMLNDRHHDPLRLLKMCTLSAALLGLGFYFFSGFAVLLVLAIVFSWFQSCALPISDSIVVETAARQGSTFSSIRLWGALSYAIGSFITGFIYEKAGYETSFLFFAVIGIPIFLSVFLFPKIQSGGHRPSMLQQMGAVYRNKPFMLFTTIGFLLNVAMAANNSFLPLYFKEKSFDLGFVGTAFAAAALVEVPVFWLTSRFVARFGRFPILSFAAGLYGVRCLLLFVLDNVYLTLLLQLLDGVSYALFAGVAAEVVGDLAGEQAKATSQAVFSAFTFGLGGIVGNAAGGAVVDAMGAPVLFLLLFVICVVAAVLYIADTGMKKTASTA